MSRILSASVMVVGALLAVASYERLLVAETIGPSAILALSMLTCLFLLLLVTRLLLKTRYRQAMANCWLVIASITITYIAVDLIAGLILIRPLSPPLVPDPYRHHRLAPDSFSEFQQRDFHYIQRVNNLGLRGEDRPLRKSPGTYRILMLGDSFTMGKGVNDDQTFSVLLESRLNRRYAPCAGKRVEVLNAGVDSYSPILSYVQLTRDLHPLEPDLVVLNLDVSDLVQEAAYRQMARFDADGELIGVPQPAAEKFSLNERVRVWAEKHLYLTRLVLLYVNRLFDYRALSVRNVVEQLNPETAAHTLADDPTPRDRQWSDVFDSILRIRTFAAGKEMDFILAAYPWGHQVNETEWVPGRYNAIPSGAVVSDASLERIAGFAASNGIRFANLFPEFRSNRGTEALYFKHDNHWTPAGHAVMAIGLERSLVEVIQPQLCRCDTETQAAGIAPCGP